MTARCPACGAHAIVTSSRPVNGGRAVRRRRSCPSCGERWTTLEIDVRQLPGLMEIDRLAAALHVVARRAGVVQVEKGSAGGRERAGEAGRGREVSE